MRIEELDRGEEAVVEELVEDEVRNVVVSSETKRVLIGAGARLLFYPTLLYNVVRNRFQAEFRWWDRVDQVYHFFLSCIVIYINCFFNILMSFGCLDVSEPI